MSTAHLTEALKLQTDALVELYTLDCSALLTFNGQAGLGQVFNWTPGMFPQLIAGKLTQVSSVSLTLDQQITPQSGGTYSVQIFHADGVTLQTVSITEFVGVGLSEIVLSPSLTSLPPVGSEYVIVGPGAVSFGGVVYQPFPITVTGYEWTGQGTLPRPKMSIDNTVLAPGSNLPLAAALVITFSDILGAKVTRTRVFAGALDGQPNADPGAYFEPDIYRIDRKSHHSKSVIEFELAADMDQMGIKLPARQVLRDVCNFTYRQWNPVTSQFVYGTCPYAGGNFFTYAGAATSDPSQDVCRKLLSACLLRFPPPTPLPIAGFPGVGLTSL